MNIVADTNILISLLIKPDGKIGALFNELRSNYTLYISGQTFVELIEHTQKILRITKLNRTNFDLLKFSILDSFITIPLDVLLPNQIRQSYYLLKDVDIDDVPFVATAMFVDGVLWTGDKKLYEALRQSNMVKCFNSQDIPNLLLK